MVTPCPDEEDYAEHLADPYKLESIAETPPPAGHFGTDWHRYEISQGCNRIVGYRVGAAETVREAVFAIVAHLNRRRRTRRGRVHMLLHSDKIPKPS